MRFGGLYVDTDFEALKPIEPVLNGVGLFRGPRGYKFVGTAVMGAVTGPPFLARLSKSARIDRPPSGDAPIGRPARTSSLPNSRPTHAQASQQHKVVVFPPEMFYPYHFSEPERRHDTFLRRRRAPLVGQLDGRGIRRRLGQGLTAQPIGAGGRPRPRGDHPVGHRSPESNGTATGPTPVPPGSAQGTNRDRRARSVTGPHGSRRARSARAGTRPRRGRQD